MAENPYQDKLETAIIAAAVDGLPFIFGKWAEKQSIAEADLTSAKVIHANFLRDLCLAALAKERWPDDRRVHPKGVNVDGLTISGTLDLTGCSIAHPVYISNCTFDKGNGIILGGARTKSFAIPGCKIWILGADGTIIDGSFVAQGTSCRGAVSFASAHITGLLNCKGATFEGDEYGLNADGLRVDGDMCLDMAGDKSFTAKGKQAVNLMGAHIAGQLSCKGATFEGEGSGLAADRLQVDSDMFLDMAGDKGFTAKGKEAVNLMGAHIAGQLNCSGATFEGGEYGLAADGLRVDSAMFLDMAGDKGFTAKGKEAIRLRGARIGGQLSCKGATFEGAEYGLSADGLQVDGDVLLDMGGNKSFTAKGREAVNLMGAHIAGQLNCSGATFEGGEYGLAADGLRVDDNVFLDEKLNATGGIAILLSHATMERSLSLDLSCVRSDLDNGVAIILSRAEIKGQFRITPMTEPSAAGWIGHIDLRNAMVDVLDDNRTSWPAANSGKLWLDGFRYRHLLHPHSNFRTEWLLRQPDDHMNGEFRPQPWEQLAKVYRESGHPEEARAVLIAKQSHFGPVIGRRALAALGVWWREERHPQWRQSQETWRALRAYLWHKFLGWTVAYGYRPLRALIYVFAIWLVGAAFFWVAQSNGLMAPTQAAANTYLANNGQMLPGYPEFQPLWYSLDVSLPVVDLHQESFWEPSAPVCNPADAKAVHAGHCAEAGAHGFRRFLEGWRVFQILSGWVLIALAVAGLTGIVKKD